VLGESPVVGIAVNGASHGLSNDGQSRLDTPSVRALNSGPQASDLLDQGVSHRRQGCLTGRASAYIARTRQSITVVRRSREVGYRRFHVGFMDDAPGDLPWVQTFAYILTSPPFIGASDKEDTTTVHSTIACNHHRGGFKGHLVARHPAKYLSCATATRSPLNLSTPAWCYGVKVPYGSMAELPWVPVDTTDDLYAGRHTP